MNDVRLAAIQNYSSSVQKEQMKNKIKEINEILSLTQAICNKEQLLTELFETAETCVKNGIHLGIKEAHSPSFVTNGITHKLGFFIKDSFYQHRYIEPWPIVGGIPAGIGFAGGGCAGENFCVGKHGEIISGLQHPQFKQLAKNFIEQIDDFANRFYSFVDDVTTIE